MRSGSSGDRESNSMAMKPSSRAAEQHQPGGTRRGAGNIEVPMCKLGAALAQKQRR